MITIAGEIKSGLVEDAALDKPDIQYFGHDLHVDTDSSNKNERSLCEHNSKWKPNKIEQPKFKQNYAFGA